MHALVLWMWLAQSADLTLTCQGLHAGLTERMSVFPTHTCKSAALQKLGVTTAVTAAALAHPGENEKVGRWAVGVVAGAGTVGFTINLRTVR